MTLRLSGAPCSVESIDWGKGLIPVTVVSVASGEVLMQAYANKEALERTLETGYAHFYSRSRGRLWMKGETSGNRLKVLRVVADCDCDGLVYMAIPSGPTCHTGRWSCFHNTVSDLGVAGERWRMIVDAFRHARVAVRRGYGGLREYLYVVNPLTDNIPPPSPYLQSLIARGMAEDLANRGPDKVVAPEALGLPIASLASALLEKPMAVVRKRRYPVEGLVAPYRSGYEEGHYYIYGVEPGDRVAIVDDALSTGGTMEAVIRALEDMGARVVGLAVSLNKPQYGGLDRVRRMGYHVWRAVDLWVKVDGGRGILTLKDPHTGAVEELEVPVVEDRG